MYSEMILSDIENFLQGNAGEPLTRSLLDKAAIMLRLQQERIAELRRTMVDTTTHTASEMLHSASGM